MAKNAVTPWPKAVGSIHDSKILDVEQEPQRTHVEQFHVTQRSCVSSGPALLFVTFVSFCSKSVWNLFWSRQAQRSITITVARMHHEHNRPHIDHHSLLERD